MATAIVWADDENDVIRSIDYYRHKIDELVVYHERPIGVLNAPKLDGRLTTVNLVLMELDCERYMKQIGQHRGMYSVKLTSPDGFGDMYLHANKAIQPVFEKKFDYPEVYNPSVVYCLNQQELAKKLTDEDMQVTLTAEDIRNAASPGGWHLPHLTDFLLHWQKVYNYHLRSIQECDRRQFDFYALEMEQTL